MNFLKKFYYWLRSSTRDRDIRFFKQRLLRGWDDSETWSLDHSLPKVILPRLKRFAELSVTYPHGLTEEQWQDILNKMIAAFEFAGSEERWLAKPEEYEKHKEGIKLFAEYYWALWW